MIKAIFFDLDGTLVSFQTHQIPQSTTDALAILKQKGIKVFIATGRHMLTIDNIGDWKPDGYVTLNGGMCSVDGNVLYKKHIDPKDIEALAKYMEDQKKFPCIFLRKNDFVMNFRNEESDEVFRLLNYPIPPILPMDKILEKPTYELLVIQSKEDEKELMEFLPNSKAIRWNALCHDIIPKHSNKWVAIEKMIDHFDIPADEVMVFGDGNNDKEMIKSAKIGVAMGNASDEVKAVADYVTCSVDDDGIWKALKNFAII